MENITSPQSPSAHLTPELPSPLVASIRSQTPFHIYISTLAVAYGDHSAPTTTAAICVLNWGTISHDYH